MAQPGKKPFSGVPKWHLIAATHNLLKLFRFQRSQQQALAAATG